ncbi:MAG: 3-deoxy-D-manno-octulosonic acid kinase [Granulosicoccus sp.]
MVDSHSLASGAVTQSSPSQPGVYWRYVQDAQPAFNPDVFDESVLQSQGNISGVAGAGRGNTFFITQAEHPLVLRHYRRGGLAQKISYSRYCYTGLERTRAMREFNVLCHLHDQSLPVPKPFACRVVVKGLSYEASIVTHKLPGKTLAECLTSEQTVSDDQWKAIGKTIAMFHKQGVYHADLNAHNIMLANEQDVALIDFDRARIRALPKDITSGWCRGNVDRLKRSLGKVCGVAGGDGSKASTSVSLEGSVVGGFVVLVESWEGWLLG